MIKRDNRYKYRYAVTDPIPFSIGVLLLIIFPIGIIYFVYSAWNMKENYRDLSQYSEAELQWKDVL